MNEPKQHFVNEIFDNAKFAISKMGKDTYAIVLHFDFCKFKKSWLMRLFYNTETHFRKYYNKALKDTELFANLQIECGMIWEEYIKGINAMKWLLSVYGWSDESLNWRCKELGAYPISEKYLREIISKVKDRLLAENVFVEKFDKNIPFFVTDEENLVHGVIDLGEFKSETIAPPV